MCTDWCFRYASRSICEASRVRQLRWWTGGYRDERECGDWRRDLRIYQWSIAHR